MKYLKYIVVGLLFVFSFIYTDKIINIIKNNDPIMKYIKEEEQNYRIESVNAIIEDDTITPSINGCTIDINKSYENMKRLNKYNDKLLKYKDLIPEITLNKIYNKYISHGNKSLKNVSIIININKSIDEINKYTDKLNIFIDSNLLIDGKININKNIRVYNGGNNNNYDDVTIEWMNDVIDGYNKSLFCINKNRNDDNLNVCARNKMHSISPIIIVNKSNIYNIKKSINNGDIIYFEENSISELNNIINYLKIKGFKIVYLDELIFSSICKD